MDRQHDLACGVPATVERRGGAGLLGNRDNVVDLRIVC